MINLRDYYPFCDNCTVEVSDEVAEVLREAERKERNYIERVRWHKAHYSLDLHGGAIENYALDLSPSPEEIYERKLKHDALNLAFQTLSPAQKRRVYAHYIGGMTKSEIALAEDVDESTVRESIRSGLCKLKKVFHIFF